MVIQPGLKGSEVFLKINDHPGIVDGGVDLQSISDDAGVVEQALAIDLGERRDPTDIETGVRFPEGLLFFENGRPAKPSLVDLQKQTAGIDGAKVFHAGTALGADGALLSVGGRVLGVTALGKSIQEAQSQAYKAVDQIHWPGGFCRRDIGWRAIKAAKEAA